MSPFSMFGEGALSALCFVASILFLRFWKKSRDRLFVFFAIAFALLGLNWTILGLLEVASETRHFVYGIRLAAFLLILAAIGDKNRRHGVER